MCAALNMMKLSGAILLASLIGSAAQGHDGSHESFKAYMSKHSRDYKVNSSEYKMRHALFVQRVAEVQQQNSQPAKLWTANVNHLSDRTEKELAQLRGWRGAHSKSKGKTVGVRAHMPGHSGWFLNQRSNNVGPRLPDQISWANLSAIQQDTNQGGCGSCWAIATTTVLNSVAEKAGLRRSFSEQDLVDCVPNPHRCGGTGGCSGATVELAMNWVVSNGIRDVESSPYYGVDRTCASSLAQMAPRELSDTDFEAMIAIGVHSSPASSAGLSLGVKHWERLPENDYLPLLRALVQHGPIAVSVAASGWTSYEQGIFNSCPSDAVVDHAVTLFGYGRDKESDVKFWEIKNSWGLVWGMNGNIRLIREDTPVCGTDWQPEVGTGCEGGPSSVKVCGQCGILYDAVAVHM